MTKTVKGKTLDQNGEIIPFANVFVSNGNGTRVTEKAHVKSDVNGNFIINVSAPIANSSGVIKFVPIGSHLTMKAPGTPFTIEPINFGTTPTVSQNLQVKMKEVTTNEVVIEENRAKYMCEKVQGGKWNVATNSCVLPKKNFWTKMKPWQKTSAVALLTALFTFSITNNQK